MLGLLSLSACNPIDQRIHIIAHRGGSNLAPENTLAAFQNAIDLGVDMIEIDIEQTSDSVVVVIHDDRVDRTTNGFGAVDSLRYDEIKKLDAGSWFDPQYKDERIPTLDQVMELIDGQVILLIEIKSGGERYPGIERRTVESILKYHAKSWVVVQSFNLKAVERIETLDRGIKTFYLLGRNFESYYRENILQAGNHDPVSFGFDGLAVHYSVLDPGIIEKIKNHGLGIYTWTVDEPEDMDRMIQAGVGGIITDSPDLLLAKLKGNN